MMWYRFCVLAAVLPASLPHGSRFRPRFIVIGCSLQTPAAPRARQQKVHEIILIWLMKTCIDRNYIGLEKSGGSPNAFHGVVSEYKFSRKPLRLDRHRDAPQTTWDDRRLPIMLRSASVCSGSGLDATSSSLQRCAGVSHCSISEVPPTCDLRNHSVPRAAALCDRAVIYHELPAAFDPLRPYMQGHPSRTLAEGRGGRGRVSRLSLTRRRLTSSRSMHAWAWASGRRQHSMGQTHAQSLW